MADLEKREATRKATAKEMRYFLRVIGVTVIISVAAFHTFKAIYDEISPLNRCLELVREQGRFGIAAGYEICAKDFNITW